MSSDRPSDLTATPGLGADPVVAAPPDDIAIRVEGLTKCFQLYDSPGHLLRQQIVARAARLFGRQPPQYFREYWALKGIDFQVRRGETVGIVGLITLTKSLGGIVRL